MSTNAATELRATLAILHFSNIQESLDGFRPRTIYDVKYPDLRVLGMIPVQPILPPPANSAARRWLAKQALKSAEAQEATERPVKRVKTQHHPYASKVALRRHTSAGTSSASAACSSQCSSRAVSSEAAGPACDLEQTASRLATVPEALPLAEVAWDETLQSSQTDALLNAPVEEDLFWQQFMNFSPVEK